MSNVIQQYITKLADRQDLSAEEAERAFQTIMNGGATPAQMAAFLMGLRMKGETAQEILAGARVMRAKMTPFPTDGIHGDIMDVCGTGGDSHGTLNISTAVAIVVAACGVTIAKHGNRSVSSKSGSSDVLKALGVEIDASIEIQRRALEECQLCFLMAPRFHAAMRHVAPVRQELKLRTIFNLLGPLTNPALPKRQMIGVFASKWLEPIAEVLRELGVTHAWVVHGADGMDELSTTGPSDIVELKDGVIRRFTISPEQFGLAVVTLDALKGGDADANARAMNLLFSKQAGAYRDIVLLNAAAALVVANKVKDIPQGLALAADAIDSGKAKETLAMLIAVTNEQWPIPKEGLNA